MGTLLQNITDFYHYVNEDLSDPRTKDFLFVSSPWPIITIMFLYRKFVHEWGPKMMKDRPAMDLKGLITIYNAIQIALSGYITYECFVLLYLPGNYSIWCQKMIWETSPLERKVVTFVWMYYMIKIVDLIDTIVSMEFARQRRGTLTIQNALKIFFVLRKKFSHVSFLHVYHHLGMCLLGFVGTKYVPGGHGVMLGFINSIVHTVMYTYYLISVVRPQWVRIWWKKYITQLQILQFLLLILHFGHVLFEPSCEYPKWVSFMFLPHNIFILFLFVDFYLKEYVYKKEKKAK